MISQRIAIKVESFEKKEKVKLTFTLKNSTVQNFKYALLTNQ